MEPSSNIAVNFRACGGLRGNRDENPNIDGNSGASRFSLPVRECSSSFRRTAAAGEALSRVWDSDFCRPRFATKVAGLERARAGSSLEGNERAPADLGAVPGVRRFKARPPPAADVRPGRSSRLATRFHGHSRVSFRAGASLFCVALHRPRAHPHSRFLPACAHSSRRPISQQVMARALRLRGLRSSWPTRRWSWRQGCTWWAGRPWCGPS